MNQDTTDKLFKTYRRGHDLAISRDQLNEGDDVLNAAANANFEEEPNEDEILLQAAINDAYEEEEPEPDENLNGAI